MRKVVKSFEDAVAHARTVWPAIDADMFVVELERRLPHGVRPEEALASLRIEELALTIAAAHGHAPAVAQIEARYFGKAKAALASIRGGSTLADEALQRVRELLFVGGPGRPPKIAGYGGRGDLARWIRTTVMRTAMDLLAPKREISDDDAVARLSAPSDDAASELMKREYGQSFQEALRAALGSLPRQTKDELRHYYFEGLGVEQIGALYGLAPSTVSRRLDKARRQLRDATRAELSQRLAVGEAELDSILRLIDTRMELSRNAVGASRG